MATLTTVALNTNVEYQSVSIPEEGNIETIVAFGDGQIHLLMRADWDDPDKVNATVLLKEITAGMVEVEQALDETNEVGDRWTFVDSARRPDGRVFGLWI